MKFLFILALSVFSLNAFSQGVTLQGVVTDHSNGNPLPGINIYLGNGIKGASTDSKGRYIISGISEGVYKLTASGIGFLSIEQEVKVSADNDLNVDFHMIESITTLSEVTIMTGSASRRKEMPGSMYYISPKEIQKFNYTDVNRTLRAIPGVNLQEEDGFGLRPNIGLRGTGVERSSKITLMEDGILMAPAPYSAPAAYYFPSIGRMQAVEVLKGSSQIKYGPYTTGGAINLISTQIPKDFGGRVSLIGSSFEGRNLHSYIGNSHKNFGYLVETLQLSSAGFKNLPNNSDTGFDKKDYMAKFRVNTNPDAPVYQSLNFKIAQTTEVSNETYTGLTETDFANNAFNRYAATQIDQMNSRQSQISLSHEAKFSEKLKLTTTAYSTDFFRNWYKLDKVIDNGNTLSLGNILDDPSSFQGGYELLNGADTGTGDEILVKANNRNYASRGIQSQLNIDFNSDQFEHNIQFGVRYHYDEVDRFQWIDSYSMEDGILRLQTKGTPGTESNRLETATAFASYIQYQLRKDKWTVTPGLRFEDISLNRMDYGKNDPERTGVELSKRVNNVSVLIPGASFEYKINNSINTFAGIHKGFAPPGSSVGSEAETSINYEWGWRYNSPVLTWEAVVFLNNYDNLLGSDLNAAGGTGSGNLFNAGQVRTKGLELQASYDLLGNAATEFRLPVSLTYTYTNAEFQNAFESNFEAWGNVNEGDQFPYLSPHQAGLNLSLEHLKFNINLNGRFIDRMRTAPGQGEIPPSQLTDRYTVWDFSSSYKVHPAVSFFGSVNNIFDATYLVARRPAGLRPGMPRSFNLGLRANF